MKWAYYAIDTFLRKYKKPAETDRIQWRRQELSGDLGRKSTSGVEGEAPVGGPPEAEAVCRYCLQILTAETIKIENFAQFTS